jgi:protoporphyrinogen oxidase
MNPSEIYILGAGPAGMAAAYTLTQQEQHVVVIERDSQVGGLAKSIDYQGFILDYGPHFFNSDIAIDPVLKLWNEVMGTEQVTFNRMTRMYWRSRYFSYPPKPTEVLLEVGFFESIRLLLSYIQAQFSPNSNPKNFAERMKAKFGNRLFEVCFEAYIEKLWGIPCTEISAEWQAGRIRNTSLLEVLKNAVRGDDGRLKFPRLGSRQLYERIAEFIQTNNQQILLNHEVVKIYHENFQVTKLILKNRETEQEEVIQCQGVISSIPLTLLLQQLSPPAPIRVVEQAKYLKFRNTVIVYLIIESSHLFPDQSIYIIDPNVRLGRVTNFANWSSDMLPDYHHTPLCCEYWCNFDESTWQQPEEELLKQAEQDLREIGLLRDENICSGFVLKLPRTHPIFTVNYQAALVEINDYLNQFQNLEVVGRNGAFKYNDQDDSLNMGILAAKKIVTKYK